jgi:hypothetical protein
MYRYCVHCTLGSTLAMVVWPKSVALPCSVPCKSGQQIIPTVKLYSLPILKFVSISVVSRLFITNPAVTVTLLIVKMFSSFQDFFSLVQTKIRCQYRIRALKLLAGI